MLTVTLVLVVLAEKLGQIHSLGTMNVWTNFHGNQCRVPSVAENIAFHQ